MKKYAVIISTLTIFLTTGCATLNSMKGTYVTITPLAMNGFDYNDYDKLGFAYTPDTENGKLLKKELSAAFTAEYFKLSGENEEIDAVQKSGINYNGEVTIGDAQKLGKIMKAKAMIIVKKPEFSGNGKADNISLEIVDTYGGVLVRASYRGGNNPDDIRSAAWSIIYKIKSENMEIERKHDSDHKWFVVP